MGSSVKKSTSRSRRATGLDHTCDWRKASILLAKCVIATLQSGGKIGMGSGLVMKAVNGKRIVERWDKDFIEALAFIGVEVLDKGSRKVRRARGLNVGNLEGQELA